jgi:hypothetical protein
MRHIYRGIAAALLTAGLCADAGAAVNSAARIATFARLPDWSGVWHVEGSTARFDGQAGGAQDVAPYNAEWQQRYATARADTARLRDSMDRFCYAGMPRVLASAQDLVFFVTPEETMVQGSRHDIRHIWTDGRAHPPADELWPLFWGDSIGHWEGQTLIVETISMKGGLWLDPTAATLSDEARVTERLTLAGRDRLRNDITIVDPKTLTRPWKFTRTYRRTAARDLAEVDCKWTAGAAGKAEK